MIRQNSQRFLHSKSRQKNKTPLPKSISKEKNHPKQPKPQSNHLTKVHKNDSKSKLPKNANATKPKLSNTHKPSSDINAMYMKNNLKQLLNKNTVPKVKNTQVVPELIRNIQKHCKELKKIHQKQQKVHDKRASLQQQKIEKQRKGNFGNKSQQVTIKKKKQLPRSNKSKDSLKAQQNRRSIQINLQTPQEPLADPFCNERLKQSRQNQENSKNFVQLFKIYKKSFEVEENKVGKSNKNTNYNTNQSKNSSTLYNSHGYSAIGQHLTKNKSRIEQKVNLDKIQNLIRSQQSSLSRQNSSAKKKTEENIELTNSRVYKLRNQDQQLNQIKEIETGKNESLEIQEEAKFEVELRVPQVLRHEFIIPEKEVSSPPKNQQVNQNHSSKQSTANKSSEIGRQKQALQRHFVKSRYYVQPIPKFSSKDKVRSQEGDSLAGCEITLIENNIVCEDSELLQLEL